MVALNLNTNDPEFANAKQGGNFEPLPDGEYIAQIIASEKKRLQSGTDTLALTWQIIDGPFKNRQIFENLYIYDPSRPKQLAFNKQKLFFIIKACKLDGINDTAELHNKPVRVTVRSSEYNGKVRNEISKYQPAGMITEVQPQPQQTREQVAAEEVPF